MIEIKDRFTERVIYSSNTAKGLREAILEAIAIKTNLSYANLSSANLSYADLSSADLRSANLSYANLSYADLSSADLRSADLRSANLSYADLRSANLRYADLRSANLRSANLRSANLSSADLRSANLRYANLRYANLTSIRSDFFDVLFSAPNEVAGLRLALIEGRVDGSTYAGSCACLVGTIANIKGCAFNAIEGLEPDSSRPIERFFLGIKKGDTPETSQFSEIAVKWIDEFESKLNFALSNRSLNNGT